ncbi:hypothetical protein Hypma_010148 [Hypsizygus marmoreus]|uniref:Uncharacterized protein n=1 Tax=Hypsizygus marmoreus TaxID=39966 RepID=A0A369JQA2_HYPMA|nr:hypothetical protein Hypma_010148 [Hypsizygus marmoreus]
MHLMSKRLCFLLIAKTAYASPVNLPESSGGSACLAVILTLFSLMSVLVICKRIFLNNRNAARASECSLTLDSYARSSTSVLPSTSSSGIASCLNDGKTGFLVGFFGSPTWETHIKNLVDDSRWKEYKQSSFMYKLHADSRRTKSSQTPSSVLTEKRSLLDRGSRSLSVSTVGDIRALYEIRDATGLNRQQRSRSLRLPSRPSIAYTGSHGSITPRRFSLPSLSRKRTSSLKSSRTVRSDVSAPSFPENTSLRLVESTNGPDYPLPLSPKHPDLQTSINTASSTIPPLPPLPSLKSGSKALAKSENILRISHPYALIATPDNTGISSMKSNARPDPLWNCLPPGPKANADDRNTVNSRQPLAPVISSINLSPLLVPYPPAAYSPKTTLSSHAILKPVVLPKIKHKGRTTSVRIRRSPAVGPSPLRSMILPEISEPNLGMRSRDSFINTHHSNVGLGLPSSPPGIYYGDDALMDHVHAPDPAEDTRQSRTNRRHNSIASESEDPNLILGIIRELVEETRDWDGSLFKDKDFKSMVQNSRLPSFKGGQAQGKARQQASAGRNGDSITKDESAELDLSLLGVDIFRSDGETFIPAENANRSFKHHSSVEGDELISFWEKGGWAEHAKRDLVGVAC